jgi:hypothetical protein
LSSNNVITCDHTDHDASFLANFYCAGNLGTNNIVDTKDTNKGQVRLLNILNFSVVGLVMLFTALAWANVSVGKSNSSEGLLGILVDDGQHLLGSVIIERSLLTLFVHVVRAAFKDHFRGALDVKSLIVATGTCSALNDS